MVEFHQANSTSYPIIDPMADWNPMLQHGLEKTASYIIRKNGAYYEAIQGGGASGAGTIAFGGADNAGPIDGTDAAAVFQAAATALATSGGKIFVSKGVYTITDTIVLGAGLVIEGESQADDTTDDGTTLSRTTDAPIFEITDHRHVWFKHLCLRGVAKGTGATPLVDLVNTCGNINFEGVTFLLSGGDGVQCNGDSYWITFRSCQALNVTGGLINNNFAPFDGGTTYLLENCVAHFSGYVADIYGVRTTNIIGGGCDNLDSFAYKLQLCSGNLLGSDIEGVGEDHAIWLVYGSMNVTGCRLLECGKLGDTKLPIYLSGEMNCKVSGNHFESTVSQYDIGLAADIENVTIEDNGLSGALGIVGYNESSTVHCINNRGYQTVAVGRGSTYHGQNLSFPYTLAGIPNIISLSATGNGGIAGHHIVVGYDPANVSTTVIKVYLYDIDDAGIVWTPDTCTVTYRVEYKPSET